MTNKQDELLPEDAIAELGNELTLDELKERVDEFGGGKFVELHYRGHLAFGLLVIQMTDGESKQAVVNEIVGKLNASRPTTSCEVRERNEGGAVANTPFCKRHNCAYMWCGCPKPSPPSQPVDTKEVKRLEEDARRYRWLRDGNDSKDSEAVRIATKCYGLEWDKAIDTAMKAALSHKEEAE